MNPTERMVADYDGTGVTVGWHPMAHCRSELRRMQVFPASHLRHVRNGTKARIAGCVIARQRPGTAHGFIFLSLEDETGIRNAIIDPDLYEQNRSLVTYGKILLIEGILQNVDKVVHIRTHRVAELTIDAQLALKSHDYYQRTHVRSDELPQDKEPPKGWYFESVCRIAAFRLRNRSTLA
jgi:error-prone DNA polymerase